MRLEVEDLTVHRGGRLVIAGLGFAVDRGEALILRGPNGVGKSTLLRALAGLAPPSGGRITLTPDLALEDHVALTGHLDAIKLQMSVAENLRFWAGLHGGDADAALIGAGLEALADRPAGFCSAGQKRRLGLARLLLAGRAIWLMDEPTVSLDREAEAWLTGQVRTHCAGGGMAVIATHVALDLPAARVLRMQRPEPQAAHGTDPFLQGRWG
ncbi:MAG: heme ABC exporter ATP-binding protein CcmA [Alphaproteobacteria bacterium]|nr:MAG: heme ABC exporter ATP-binding protein CcmA [Alphaproteobacteria bacterium]